VKTRLKIFIWILLIGIFSAGVYTYLPSYIGDSVYPLEYRDIIKKYATQFGVDPNLVCAVIYSESHFHANATSPVGARGLMQVMPQTGAGIAKQLGEGGSYNANNLYDPETAIRYGVWYLKHNLDKYASHSNQVELVLIAYNGGVGLSDRYAVRPFALNSETANYIVKVQKAKAAYDSMYGQWWIGDNQPITAAPAPQPAVVQPTPVAVVSVIQPPQIQLKKQTLETIVVAWIMGWD